jgi:hypothetical protein
MDLYSILRFAHVVCTVYGVGGSVCVLIAARPVR